MTTTVIQELIGIPGSKEYELFATSLIPELRVMLEKIINLQQADLIAAFQQIPKEDRRYKLLYDTLTQVVNYQDKLFERTPYLQEVKRCFNTFQQMNPQKNSWLDKNIFAYFLDIPLKCINHVPRTSNALIHLLDVAKAKKAFATEYNPQSFEYTLDLLRRVVAIQLPEIMQHFLADTLKDGSRMDIAERIIELQNNTHFQIMMQKKETIAHFKNIQYALWDNLPRPEKHVLVPQQFGVSNNVITIDSTFNAAVGGLLYKFILSACTPKTIKLLEPANGFMLELAASAFNSSELVQILTLTRVEVKENSSTLAKSEFKKIHPALFEKTEQAMPEAVPPTHMETETSDMSKPFHLITIQDVKKAFARVFGLKKTYEPNEETFSIISTLLLCLTPVNRNTMIQDQIRLLLICNDVDGFTLLKKALYGVKFEALVSEQIAKILHSLPSKDDQIVFISSCDPRLLPADFKATVTTAAEKETVEKQNGPPELTSLKPERIAKDASIRDTLLLRFTASMNLGEQKDPAPEKPPEEVYNKS